MLVFENQRYQAVRILIIIGRLNFSIVGLCGYVKICIVVNEIQNIGARVITVVAGTAQGECLAHGRREAQRSRHCPDRVIRNAINRRRE